MIPSHHGHQLSVGASATPSRSRNSARNVVFSMRVLPEGIVPRKARPSPSRGFWQQRCFGRGTGKTKVCGPRSVIQTGRKGAFASRFSRPSLSPETMFGQAGGKHWEPPKRPAHPHRRPHPRARTPHPPLNMKPSRFLKTPEKLQKHAPHLTKSQANVRKAAPWPHAGASKWNPVNPPKQARIIWSNVANAPAWARGGLHRMVCTMSQSHHTPLVTTSQSP